MKQYHLTTTRTLSLAALAFAIGTVTTATADDKNRSTRTAGSDHRSQTTGTTGTAHAGTRIQVAAEDARQRGVEHLIGKEVRGANGQKVGTIEDFVIDPSSGQVVFTIVSSGGFLGVADTLRLVPFEAVKQTPSRDAFTTAVEQSDWSKLPTIAEEDFERGMINITEDQKRQLAGSQTNQTRQHAGSQTDQTRQHAGSQTDQTRQLAGSQTNQTRADYGQRFVAVSTLEDRELQANGREIGSIEDVVVDFDEGSAMALVETDSEFSGSERAYLVPFAQFQFTGGKRDAITTTLTRADFERAEPARTSVASTRASDRDESRATHTTTSRQSATVADAQDRSRARQTTGGANDAERRASNVDDEQLTPTGRTPTGQTAQSTNDIDPAIESAVRSVRQIWEAEPALAKLNLQVAAENGQLVLSGSVPNAELWERAEDAAERVITGIKIHNRIAIKAR